MREEFLLLPLLLLLFECEQDRVCGVHIYFRKEKCFINTHTYTHTEGVAIFYFIFKRKIEEKEGKTYIIIKKEKSEKNFH